MLSRVSAAPVRLPDSRCSSSARRQCSSASSRLAEVREIQPTAFSE